MRVLQFGFGTAVDDFHRPNKFPAHSVGYTGTHDNDTLLGWYRNYLADPKQVDVVTPFLRELITAYPDLASKPLHWQLIASVLHSAANSAVVPVQDILGLGNEARMNVPGEAKGNWAWRLHEGQLTSEISRQLFDLVIESGRS
jgi:4-alpha-glucanotransferase